MVLDVLVGRGVPIAFANTQVRPRLVEPDSRLGAALGATRVTAALEMIEVMHLAGGEAVQYTVDVFAPGSVDLHVIRGLEVPELAGVSGRAWAAFAAVSILWGIPYLFIKIAVDDGVSPAFLAWVRVVLGAAVLLALSWRLGLLGSLRGRWWWLAVFAVVEIVIPFPLIAFGEQHVASSLAAVIIAAAPLFVALLALRFDHSERVTGSRLAGLLIGLAGVAALVGIDVAGQGDELLGAAAVLVAALGYAIGPMVLKRNFADLDPRCRWEPRSPSRR